MRDISDQLEALRHAASSAAFEASFAKEVTSLGALQITLSHARDQLLRGLDAIDTAFAVLDHPTQHETPENPNEQ